MPIRVGVWIGSLIGLVFVFYLLISTGAVSFTGHTVPSVGAAAAPPTATRVPGRTLPGVPLATLTGHVTWQGRPPQPNVLQQLPLTLVLQSGATQAVFAG